MNKLEQSYKILDDLRLPHGLYLASPSDDYSYVWLRDSFYEVLPYLNSTCDRYEKTYHRILDMFRQYEWKLDIHTKQKPHEQWEYIHARYDANTVTEIDTPWGHSQHDSIGAILFGIAEGVRVGKQILRDSKDQEIVRKIVDYLACCEYWRDEDSGSWEENREVHSSSVGACVAGLIALKGQNVVNVPSWLITKGYNALGNMFPFESSTKPVDLAQLSLVYPYKVAFGVDALEIVERVEKVLLRERGCIRYIGDSYYSTIEHLGRHLPVINYIGTEAEWCFGLPWLALCHMELGNYDKAAEYIKRTEAVMLEDGSIPELYLSGSDKYNGNTPLGWANSLYILAKERMNNFN
jgi:GH15 family glucan-1,4-alpha-glucosidase